ncbi:histone deacetylase superfamily protein [Nannochloropsis gaditana]|uniref:histone deacetylase n=1 Tax=Nannochloropsis gaditana TaxID=72520 RepID=W7U535_9STRA|nr:histone deacetylase superfamily protein [Nannochloropsis gaditana]
MAANAGAGTKLSSALTKSTTGYVWHERYMWHHAGKYTWNEWIQPTRHFESPESKRRLHNLLDASGLLDCLVRVPPRLASVEELTRFHTLEYVGKIQSLSRAQGGEAGDFATFGPGSYEIACLAVGGVLNAIDAVVTGRTDTGDKVRNAYCLARPPGHHAEKDRGMGFCLFNNVALGAMHARVKQGLKRVAIVDYDVHHGNGTQQAFYEDEAVLFISIHQDSNYPAHTGYVEENGTGKGEGTTINIPLPPGSGSGAYFEAFDRVILPAVRAFAPELLLVSSGYDAGYLDPLATMMLSSEHFRTLGQKLNGLAEDVCDGRIVYVHEGGYSDLYVPFCGHAIVEELTKRRTGVRDCMLTDVHQWGYQELQPHQDAVIKKCEALVTALKRRMAGMK